MAGFVGDPGKDFKTGDTPTIAKRLDTLAKKLGITIYGISGYRTPSHSVRVGGFANDPHTRGQAIDIGVGAQTKQSASQLTDAQLASVGLYRPFPGADEVNHVQLIQKSPAKATMQANTAGGGGLIPTVIKDIGQELGGGPAAPLGVGSSGTDPITSLAGDVAGGIVNDIWKSIASNAAYAGLFVLMIAAGAWLAVQGLSKSTKEPA